MTIRKRVVVHGFVQGVFFRASIRNFASRLGLRGWARNRTDETVEAVFEGRSEDVDEAIEFCRLGPLGAKVDRIEIFTEPIQDEMGFKIR